MQRTFILFANGWDTYLVVVIRSILILSSDIVVLNNSIFILSSANSQWCSTAHIYTEEHTHSHNLPFAQSYVIVLTRDVCNTEVIHVVKGCICLSVVGMGTK